MIQDNNKQQTYFHLIAHGKLTHEIHMCLIWKERGSKINTKANYIVEKKVAEFKRKIK